MHDEICYASAFELAWNIRSRAVSPVEVITAHLERIEALNASVNAVVTVPDGLLDLAREAETALMRGNIWGPLHGVPFTVKDCFDTQGVRTTRGSRLFENRIPMYDSTAALRLKEAGALLLGKTNLPEFALRSETSNLVFGTTRNPWNKEKTCGGSSGGEATAIACGFSPLGIGSDLGGSNRLPSHYCGVVGLKPTHGRIPMTGHWPELLLRYMHAGPIARTVRDVALVLPILNGPDNRDPYGLSVRSPRFEDLRAPLPPLRVGWFDCGPFDPVDPEIREAVRRAASVLQELGCRLEEVSFPHWKEPSPIDATMMLVFGEGIHYLNPFVKKRRPAAKSVHPCSDENFVPQSGRILENHRLLRAVAPGHHPILFRIRTAPVANLSRAGTRPRCRRAGGRRPDGPTYPFRRCHCGVRVDRFTGGFRAFQLQPEWITDWGSTGGPPFP